MLTDDSCEPKPMSKEEIVETLKTMVFGAQAFERFSAKEREALDKAWNLIDQYEARLKADMVAMLTDIQLEIEENYNSCMRAKSVEIIQQKINALKENA